MNNVRLLGKFCFRNIKVMSRHYLVILQELDYIPAIPLCYCKAGYAEDIIRNLNAANFDGRNINYDIDRYIVKSADDKDSETFIVLLTINLMFNQLYTY